MDVSNILGRTWARGLLLLAMLCVSMLSEGSPPSVGIVYSGESSVQRRVISAIEASFDNRDRSPYDLSTLHLYDIDNPPKEHPEFSLVITLGLRAALHYDRSMPRARASLHGLLSKASLNTIIGELDETHHAVVGIYLDQPPERLLRLAKSSLPQLTTVGFVLGPESPVSRSEITDASTSLGLKPVIEQVYNQTDLLSALDLVMEQAQALIAVPDTTVYNRYTVQKILLSTYREGIPVIAFSSALARAGATLAVYSTPEQIGRHMGEEALTLLIQEPLNTRSLLKPRYYSIAINRQVVRSLGLNIPDSESLLRELKE